MLFCQSDVSAFSVSSGAASVLPSLLLQAGFTFDERCAEKSLILRVFKEACNVLVLLAPKWSPFSLPTHRKGRRGRTRPVRAVSDFRGNLRKTKKLELIFSREAEMKISISHDRTEFGSENIQPQKD